MKKYMPLEGLRWSRDSGSALCDTPQNSRSRTGWGGKSKYFLLLMMLFYVNEALAWRYSAKMRAALSTLAAQGRDL